MDTHFKTLGERVEINVKFHQNVFLATVHVCHSVIAMVMDMYCFLFQVIQCAFLTSPCHMATVMVHVAAILTTAMTTPMKSWGRCTACISRLTQNVCNVSMRPRMGLGKPYSNHGISGKIKKRLVQNSVHQLLATLPVLPLTHQHFCHNQLCHSLDN